MLKTSLIIFLNVLKYLLRFPYWGVPFKCIDCSQLRKCRRSWSKEYRSGSGCIWKSRRRRETWRQYNEDRVSSLQFAEE